MKSFAGRHGLTILTCGLLGGLLLWPLQAAGKVVGTGTATSCTEAALNTALVGGGSITFDCGGRATIRFTSPKTIAASTTIDGGGLITLSGGNATSLIAVNSAVGLTLLDLTLTNAVANGASGAIVNNGALTLDHVTFANNTSQIYSTGAVTAINSVFSENPGGGIFDQGGHRSA